MARHKCIFTHQLPVSKQPGASRCTRCYQRFRCAGGRAVHRCRVPSANSVLVPTSSLSVGRSSLSVGRLRLYSAAHVIVHCVGVVLGHPVSPDSIVDVVSRAMLIKRT